MQYKGIKYPQLVYEQCPTEFYEVECVNPIEAYYLQLDAKPLIYDSIEIWTQNQCPLRRNDFLRSHTSARIETSPSCRHSFRTARFERR
jgi:hypothetical protein